MDNGTIGWLAREVMRYGGLYLAARGVGDEALWASLSGALSAAAGSLWSWQARKALKAGAPK